MLSKNSTSEALEVLMQCETDASTLPLWRYKLRERLIPIVRWETPYLASLQAQLRTPVLDQYFAFRYDIDLGEHVVRR
jgi:hypothetical protein